MSKRPHSTLKQVDKISADYYKAAFVRNPFERLVSWYADIDTNARNRHKLDNYLRSQVKERAKSFSLDMISALP